MNPNSNKCLFTLLVYLLVNSHSFAKEFSEESLLKAMDSVSCVDPLRNPSEDGSMISWLSENPSPIPLFYPKLVPLFEFMDMGDTKLYTLEQLSANPRLGPRPVLRQGTKSYFSIDKPVREDKKVVSLENRLRELEAKLLEVEAKPVYRPDDAELKAFILEGKEGLTPEQRLEYLSKVISEAKGKADSETGEQGQIVVNQNPSILPINDVPEFLGNLPVPPLAPPQNSTRSSASKPFIPKTSRSVLKFKASIRTPQGAERPAQASEFYLTTQNLHDLLSDLNLNRAIAGEVQSVAELWARAEKDSTANPEIALGVKSILLQAKVSKTRTDPFGKAEIENVSPDDEYYLIGLDKDDRTGVITIWSKHIEVSPGENIVELTSNDVIYHE